MYLSQQYLDIGGKFIENPFSDNERMFSVSLQQIVFRLHESGARHITDFQAIIMSCVESEIGLDDTHKSAAIYKRIMARLSELGVVPIVSTH